jgi:formylglycine-generating enzyme required for sulfatase activity
MKTPRCTGLLALALASLLLALPAQAARLALVIGNDNYQQVSTLKNAGNDAKLMAGALRSAGFDVSDHFNLDRNRLYEAIDGFQKRLGKGDEVVFYFSGHGVQVDNDPMLLPTDIQANDEKKLKREALPLLYVQDALKDARVSLLVIDACRDNPFPKQGTRTIGDTRGLRPPDVVKGQAIILSAGRNQKALDSVPGQPNQKNGLFTHEFVRVMRTPGLDVRSALVKVRDDVEDKAARVNHEQRPSLMDDMRGNFYLQASIKPEPTPDRPRPGPDGLNLDDLKKEDDNKKSWAQWQTKMKADHEQANAISDRTLRAKALERLLGVYKQDNPWSSEDDTIRSQASSNLQRLRAQAQQTQSISPPGQSFKDCADCPEMVVIPAGSFQMGSKESGKEQPIHSVNIKSFALGKYEVTQSQWKAVMGSNLSRFSGFFSRCDDNCPVEMVSWDDIQKYIQKLNQKMGQRYRLPSEAEWEYAARAGTTTKYWWGDTASHEYANYGKDECCGGLSQGRDKWENTAPVGQFAANAFGLHDMHGNVGEWVQDFYHDNYIGAPSDGSAWESGGQQMHRVLRGGSWDSSPANLRLANRSRGTPDGRGNKNGFRLARTAP